MNSESFNKASQIIGDTLDKYVNKYKSSAAGIDNLKKACADIDALSKMLETHSVNIEIDEDNMELSISMSCFDVVMQSKEFDLFYDIVRRSSNFGFKACTSNAEYVEMYFVFNGIFMLR